MSQEKLQMCSTSGGGGGGIRSWKRIKQNKAPQRGLGVEKLERIRLEEQRKNGSVDAAGPVVVPVPPQNQYQSTPSVPFPSETPPDLSSLPSSNTCLLGSHPTEDMYTHNINQISSSSTIGGSAVGWPLGVTDCGGLNPALNSENTRLETRFSNGSSLQSPNDSRPNWPPLVLMQWRQYNQQHFSSMMNQHLLTSSGINFQIEPPSNQNIYSNYIHPPMCPDDKTTGMKRSWPFSLENLSDSSAFPSNVQPLLSSFGRSDESYANGNQTIREGPSGANLQTINWKESPYELNHNKRIKGNGTIDGDFLSLGIPASAPPSKFKQPFAIPIPDYHELSKLELLPFQESIEEQVMNSKGSIQQQHSFFPIHEQYIGQPMSASKDEVVDGVDLTLKL